jgi:hypothetical protein
MIVVRNVFQLKFGRAKEAKALMKQGVKLATEAGFAPDRVLIDVTGRFYTMVMENSYPSLSAFEASTATGFRNETWEQWYQKFVPLCEGGYREVFSVMEG